jgi:2-polyprenyl-3-methyl-5-hydroxy-6-metoxy-1,4-benzoquinol methylase
VHALTIDNHDNVAWYRQVAAGWARRMITGHAPAAWALHTDSDVQFALTQLDLYPGDRVLDLGCGWGRHSLALAAQGLRVTGVDISHELLTLAAHQARRRGLSVDWVEADVADLPFDGMFDAVAQFCGNLLTWFPDRDRTLDVLGQITRLLRPGGRLLIGTDDWQPELPARSQEWDEWRGGAAIYRHRYDSQCRIAHAQTVIFDAAHQRREFRRQTWWPALCDMESLFAEVGLAVVGRSNGFHTWPYDPDETGLVYVLARTDW